MTVDAADDDEATNVELALLVQQWTIHVLLNDVRFGHAILVRASRRDDIFDFLQCGAHSDAVASVGVLAGLQDPYVPHFAVGGDLQLSLLLEGLMEACELLGIFWPF